MTATVTDIREALARRELIEKMERRLSNGQCPIHGTALVQTGVTIDASGPIEGCPRRDCSFELRFYERVEEAL